MFWGPELERIYDRLMIALAVSIFAAGAIVGGITIMLIG
jgi:hypothetical protein